MCNGGMAWRWCVDGTEAMCTVVCQGPTRSGFARVRWHRGRMSGNIVAALKEMRKFRGSMVFGGLVVAMVFFRTAPATVSKS